MHAGAPKRFVGRVAERKIIERALRAVERDRSAGVVEVVGEPGIGKTALLGTIGRSEIDGLLLVGRAAEFERDVPFGVFVDALDRHLAVVDCRAQLLGAEGTRQLAAIFPSLEMLFEGPATALGHERFRSHRAVRLLLERLAGERPLVLVLDDLHWADPASCELIASLLRRPPAAPVLLALAYRAGRAPAELAGALAAMTLSLPIARIELNPLTHAESLELLGSEVRGAAAREQLYRKSGGNPFYLEQLARPTDWIAGPVRRGAGKALEGDVPLAVAYALAAEVGALSVCAQAVVQAAAVAGEPFEPDLVARIAALAERDGLIALDELLARDLIRETPVARQFRFRHPLVRHAVYGSISAGRRLDAHARTASALAERGAGPMVCAPHVEQSASVGDEAAVTLLAAAGASAAGRALASSAHWWQAALRLVPEHGVLNERRRELLLQVAAALAAAGRLEDSHSTWLEALDQLPLGDANARAGLIASCAGVEQLLGHFEQARQRLLGARGRPAEYP